MSSPETEDMVEGYEDADDDHDHDDDHEYNYNEYLQMLDSESEALRNNQNQGNLDFKKLTDSIQKNCPEILRNFWEPVKAKELELSGSRYVTKFGGSNPFRGNNFRWPRCTDEDCDRQKSFICQINLATIPDKSIRHLLKDFGLFQCFFCTSLFCQRDNLDKEGDHTRFIPKSEMIPSLKTLASFVVFESKADTGNLPKVLQEFVEKNNEQFEEYDEHTSDTCDEKYDEEYVGEEKQVKSWKESNVKEVPLPYEMTGNDKLSNRLLALPGITEDFIQSYNMYINDTHDARPIAHPQYGVKIGGYVNWFQGDFNGYSRCEDCQLEMDIPFVQLDSHEDLQEYDWDSGSANILLCPGCGKPSFYWHRNP